MLLKTGSDRSRRPTAVAVGYLAVAEFAVAEFCKAVDRRKAVGGQIWLKIDILGYFCPFFAHFKQTLFHFCSCTGFFQSVNFSLI